MVAAGPHCDTPRAPLPGHVGAARCCVPSLWREGACVVCEGSAGPTRFSFVLFIVGTTAPPASPTSPTWPQVREELRGHVNTRPPQQLAAQSEAANGENEGHPDAEAPKAGRVGRGRGRGRGCRRRQYEHPRLGQKDTDPEAVADSRD